jgi:hypothetical protein
MVPMFLIISSSVYPAIISGIENKENSIISNVMAQLEKTSESTNTKNYYSTLPTPSSQDLIPSSPTPISPNFSASHSAREPNETPTTPARLPQQDEGESKMEVATINVGDLVHTIWEDDTSGNSEIFYKRDGADYDPSTKKFTTNAGTSNAVAIAVSDNIVYIVWKDENGEIMFRKSVDSGATFGDAINLSNSINASGNPAIAVSGNTVHVVWTDNISTNADIFYRRSTDGGESFTEPIKNLSNNVGESQQPAIGVSDNIVHVVWADNTSGDFDIKYRRSINGGISFPNTIKTLSNAAASSFEPAIAVSGDTVHTVWRSNTPGNIDIFYRRSLDNGGTFPNIIKNLSSNAGTSGFPAIAASGSILHVVWADLASGTFEILYRRSLDGGSTFPNAIKTLSSDGSSFSPVVALSASNVYVVWYVTPIGENDEIMYRTSTNNGDTFPAVITNLSVNDGISRFPSLAVS